jgi:hypothetical protein
MAPVVSRDANSKLIAAMMLSHYSKEGFKES